MDYSLGVLETDMRTTTTTKSQYCSLLEERSDDGMAQVCWYLVLLLQYHLVPTESARPTLSEVVVVFDYSRGGDCL